MKQILICTACVVALSSASAPARTTTERDAAAQVAAKSELIVQARQSASQPGAGRAVAGQQIKLLAPATLAPALPGVKGAVKDDAGFDQDPMQCTTGQDGACAIALPREQFPVSATYEADADVTGQAGVNARPGPVAGPAAGLFAFGFMPAMSPGHDGRFGRYDGNIVGPDGSILKPDNLMREGIFIATDGTKWCTYGDGGPKTTPITPKSLGEGVFDPGQPETPPKSPGVVTKPDGTTVFTKKHQEGTKTVYNPKDKTLTTYDPDGKKVHTIKDVTYRDRSA